MRKSTALRVIAWLLILPILIGMTADSAPAHEFIIKPAQLQVESGAKLPFSIMATHFFFASEEVEPVDTVKAWLVEGDKSAPVAVKENHILQTLDGVAKLDRKGTSLLVSHLQEPIEPIKLEGSSRSQKIKKGKVCQSIRHRFNRRRRLQESSWP